MADVAAPGQMQFGLPGAAVTALCGVLAQYPQIDRAIVYGSRAKGNYRPESDIDLTLDAPTLTLTELLRIETKLDDLMLPYQMDVSLLAQIDNPQLRNHIDRVGKVLWKSLHTFRNQPC